MERSMETAWLAVTQPCRSVTRWKRASMSPPVDGVERASNPVSEAHPEVLAVHLDGAGLSPGVGAEVVLEVPGKSGHVPGLGAFSGGVGARGDLAEEFLGHAAGVVRSDAAEASECDALVGSRAAAGAGAVVDDEGLGAGRAGP